MRYLPRFVEKFVVWKQMGVHLTDWSSLKQSGTVWFDLTFLHQNSQFVQWKGQLYPSWSQRFVSDGPGFSGIFDDGLIALASKFILHPLISNWKPSWLSVFSMTLESQFVVSRTSEIGRFGKFTKVAYRELFECSRWKCHASILRYMTLPPSQPAR
jgi:hypothetical protein